LAAVIGLLLLVAHAQAQAPTPDDALRASEIVRGYVSDWAVPTQPDAASRPPGAVGACVTLKLDGKVIARGAAWSDVIAGPEAMSVDVLRRAALAAIKQAQPHLGVPNDAMRDAAMKLAAQNISIGVELAGPLTLVRFDTWDEAEMTLRPGLDGVAVRVAGAGEGVGKDADPGELHAMFPSQMMLGNMLPHRAMAAAVSKAMGEGGAAAALEDPKKLREASGVRMYRFRVGHAVRAGNSDTPSVLYRGQRLLPASQATTLAELRDMLRSMADDLSKHVLARAKIWMAPPPADPKQTYPKDDPRLRPFETARFTRGLRSDGIDDWASETENAVVALALKRHDEYLGDSAHGPFIGKVVAGIRLRNPDGSDMDPRVFASVFEDIEGMAIDSTPGGTGFRALSLAKRPIMLSGMAGLQDIWDSERTSMQLEECVLPAFASLRDGALASAMPALGWAAMEVAAARKQERETKRHFSWARNSERRPIPVEIDDIPAAIALRRMRDQCWAHQLSIIDAGEDAMDMVGGIVFTSGLGDGRSNPYPTWQCARPLAFIATMLRDPRLTEPHERAGELVRLMQAMRFLRQLQVDEASAWMYPEPKLAIGGIRAATWDNSLPVDAASMTLLCVVEMLKSLDELSKSSVVPDGSPTAPGVGKGDTK
jgi:hypothetical protein